jgi:5-methylcytosine-specific restriction endonuclease McrA
LKIHEIEHIIAEKHGGATQEANLALTCPDCNRFKGTDLGSLDPATGRLTPFSTRALKNEHNIFATRM